MLTSVSDPAIEAFLSKSLWTPEHHPILAGSTVGPPVFMAIFVDILLAVMLVRVIVAFANRQRSFSYLEKHARAENPIRTAPTRRPSTRLPPPRRWWIAQAAIIAGLVLLENLLLWLAVSAS